MLNLLGNPEKTERIRQLNDAFRTTFAGGMVVMSTSVAELPDMVRAAALKEVAEFDTFDETNDPYEEHDFGPFEVDFHRIFFKIDYLDQAVTCHSPDPADPSVTKRVITIMLAEEY